MKSPVQRLLPFRLPRWSAAFLVVALTALLSPACDQATGPDAPPSLSLRLDGADGTVVPGRTLVLVVEDLTLDAVDYSVTLDGESLSVMLPEGTGDRLVFRVPQLAPGSHELELRVGDRSGSITLNSVSAPTIAEPQPYITAALDDLGAALAAAAETAEPDVRATLASAQQQLADLGPEVAALMADEQREVAEFLAALLTDDALSSPAMASHAGPCEDMQSAFKRQLGVTVASAAALLIGAGSAPTVVGGFLGGLSFGVFLIYIDKLKATEVTIADVCLTEATHRIVGTSGSSFRAAPGGSSRSAVEPLTFVDGEPETFRVTVERTVADDALELIQSIPSRLGSLLANDWIRGALPANWVDYLTADRSATKTEPAEGARFSIGDISDDAVAGSADAAGSDVELRFFHSAGSIPANALPFTFELLDSELPGHATRIPADLLVRCRFTQSHTYASVHFTASVECYDDADRTELTVLEEVASNDAPGDTLNVEFVRTEYEDLAPGVTMRSFLYRVRADLGETGLGLPGVVQREREGTHADGSTFDEWFQWYGGAPPNGRGGMRYILRTYHADGSREELYRNCAILEVSSFTESRATYDASGSLTSDTERDLTREECELESTLQTFPPLEQLQLHRILMEKYGRVPLT